MNLIRRHISLLLILILSLGVIGRDWQWLSVDKGLPSTLVNDILQDRYGFVWLATDNGISRFDGTSFKVFHAGETVRKTYD